MRRPAVGSVFAMVVALASALMPTAAGPARAAGPTAREVDEAVAKGVAWLKEEQGPRGEWRYEFNLDHTLGATALAGLALMENGLDAGDPAVGKAAEVVRVLARRSDQTYDVALSILFLARSQKGQPGPADALIRRLAARLEAGGVDGYWSYNIPGEATAGGEDDSPPSGSRPRLRSRARRGGEGDNSNTQFALLGLWAAGRHGFAAGPPLAAIDGHFRSTADSRGLWGYLPEQAPTHAMTCAGLLGLAVGASRPELAERQTARARGAALAADPAFTRALAGVARDARDLGPHSDIYYLWSLERVCVALGLRDLNGFDWYAAGATELIRRQRPDGQFQGNRWGPLPDTALALLFLRKANLAFELDRVLRLPGAARPGAASAVDAPPADPAPAPVPVPAGGASVVVTGADDAGFPEIAVDFEVRRPDGSFLLDGRRDDFKVTEDDAPVEILRFQAPLAREARPVTVVLVVDRSRSMEEEDRIGSLKAAVGTFLDGLPAGSRVALVAFGSEVELLCPFTGDPGRVREAVGRLKPAGATRYYDAVAASLDLIGRESGRRAVLAMTDGEDTFSQTATLATVTAEARRLGLPVHTLGLGSEDEIESDALRRLAASTRGQYYPARQADQLKSVYEQLAERLRSGYTLAYRTDRKLPDGTLRPVRVAYRKGGASGVTAVFIPGMVVPAAGWSRLFLLLLAALAFLSLLPGRISRRRSSG